MKFFKTIFLHQYFEFCSWATTSCAQCSLLVTTPSETWGTICIPGCRIWVSCMQGKPLIHYTISLTPVQ